MNKVLDFLMKFVVLAFLVIFLGSCSESTNITMPVTKDDKGKVIKKERISWAQFQEYCGQQNIMNKENFKSVQNATIIWRGTIYAIREDAGVKDSNSHAPKIIQVKMPNSKSLLTDVTLRLPKGSEKIYSSMKKGDNIVFKGKIAYLGSKLNDHIVLVEQFKKEPKKKK